jgi:hypothetical protein
VATKAGVALAPAQAGGEVSTGTVVEKAGRSVLPLVCML